MGAEEEGNGVSGAIAAAREGCIRIYVGGLGGSVSADDLKKTFSAPQVGNVDSVEIVRTKGRSFAYLDFLPASEKGLAKLFSMYNGCMWKGGRLRLEKAKEHYLLRLKQEWAEDAEVSSDSQNHEVVSVDNPHMSEKLLKIRNSEKQLHIFFPKLRKVKSLPFKGTGKHKYSFQHIEVPPLPIHFCDCEEHSVAFEPCQGEPPANLEKESGGINDEELSLMNSIMSKIFQRENCLETDFRSDEFAKEGYNSTSLNDGLQFDDTLSDQDSDEDNLIINVVAGSRSGNKVPLSNIQGPKPVTSNQDSESSKAKIVQRMHRKQGKMLTSYKKRKEPHAEAGNTNDSLTINAEKKAKPHQSSDDLKTVPDTQPTRPSYGIPQSSYNHVKSGKAAFRDLVIDRDNASFRISDITADTGPKAETADTGPIAEASTKSDDATVNCIVEEEIQITKPFLHIEENRSMQVVPNGPDAEINKLSKSTSWSQKSSWMQLIGSSADSSFSISQIVSGLNVENQDHQLHKGTDSLIPVNGNHATLSSGDVPKSQAKEDKVFPDLEDSNQSSPANEQQASRDVKDSTSPSKRHPFRPMQTSGGGTGSESFTFMRNAASMKEWMKAKTALSGSLKKKQNEK